MGICLMLLMVMAGIATGQTEKETTNPLRFEDGRPVIRVGDRYLSSAYSETYPWDDKMNKRNQQFAKAGVNVFVLIVRQKPELDDWHSTSFWYGEGKYGTEKGMDHQTALNVQARKVLEENPDARFIIRWGGSPPKGFRKSNPKHFPRGREGKRTIRASLASDKTLKGIQKEAKHIINYVQSTEWGDRVIGYAMLPMGEGITMHSIKGRLFDQTPVMQEAFNEYLKETYNSDSALQNAWGKENVTRENAKVPEHEEWREETEDWMHWPDPSKTRRYRDYFRCVRELYLRRVRTLARSVDGPAKDDTFFAYDGLKQPMMGWLIKDSFAAAAHGMDFPSLHLGSGSIGVAPAMEIPELDAIMTPADYTARSVGFGFEGEGVNDSMILRDKAMFIEDDARSWASSPGRSTQGAWRNEKEMKAGLLRNTAISFSRGIFNYWMNVGKGFYEDQTVMDHISEQVPLRNTMMQRPRAETEHAIAMIIDDTSPLWEDFTTGFQHLAVLRQRLNELAVTGLPYRVYLLSDLKRDDFPTFRAYLFPNLFKLNQERIELIRNKVINEGSVAIFGPGTGITNGKERTAELSSELLGFPLELKMKETVRYVLTHGDHPAMKHVSGPTTYGDSYIYGPVLQPERDLGKAEELGKSSMWFGSNRSGLVLREFGKGAVGSAEPGDRGEGDGAVVFSVATPIPAEVLRSLAIYGGANPWSSLGDVVGANKNTVAVHSRRSGKRTIQLPRKATVNDLFTGETVAEDTQQFEITLDAPETRIFGLSPALTPGE